jgi:translation initiation factor 2B subunit (eIF-2B alpha/beta/delta family)
MKNVELLNNMIQRILKEELDKNKKGVPPGTAVVTVPEELVDALIDSRTWDDQIFMDHRKDNEDGSTTFILKARTPEFKSFKNAINRAMYYIRTPSNKDRDEYIRNTGDDYIQDIIDDIKKDLDIAEKQAGAEVIKSDIKQGIKEYDINNEEANTFVGRNALNSAKNSPEYRELPNQSKKNVEDKLEKGGSVTLENKAIPSSTEVTGKIAELMDSLKAISEGSQDSKVHKITEKASAQLEAAKKTLEALTAHEVMLQEKEHEMYVKQASKKKKMIEKYLKKSIKMPEVVERLMKKLPDDKVADMMKKAKGELDEKKVAGAMMKVALKENYLSQDQVIIA